MSREREQRTAANIGPFALRATIYATRWDWDTCGALTRRFEKTACQLTVQHQLSEGSVLISGAGSFPAGVGGRRSVARPWNTGWNARQAGCVAIGAFDPCDLADVVGQES